MRVSCPRSGPLGCGRSWHGQLSAVGISWQTVTELQVAASSVEARRRVEVPADIPSEAPTAGPVKRPEPVVDPPDAVVLLARAGAGPLASDCCSVIDFYTNAAAAHAALDVRGLTGVVLPLRVAHALGAHLFGRLPAT